VAPAKRRQFTVVLGTGITVLVVVAVLGLYFLSRPGPVASTVAATPDAPLPAVPYRVGDDCPPEDHYMVGRTADGTAIKCYQEPNGWFWLVDGPVFRVASDPPPIIQTAIPQPSRPSQPTVGPGGCHPVTAAGNCYEPGEFCPRKDRGDSGLAGDGETIICINNNGFRWEPVPSSGGSSSSSSVPAPPPPSCTPPMQGTPPDCTSPPPSSCPPGETGTYPDCTSPTCPPGETGTPPACSSTSPPPPSQCPSPPGAGPCCPPPDEDSPSPCPTLSTSTPPVSSPPVVTSPPVTTSPPVP
jgi:hypothetical protein